VVVWEDRLFENKNGDSPFGKLLKIDYRDFRDAKEPLNTEKGSSKNYEVFMRIICQDSLYPTINVSENSTNSYSPSVVIDNNGITHIVWYDGKYKSRKILYRRYEINNGWVDPSPQTLVNKRYVVRCPSIGLHFGKIYIVYEYNVDGNYWNGVWESYVKVFSGGWGEPERLGVGRNPNIDPPAFGIAYTSPKDDYFDIKYISLVKNEKLSNYLSKKEGKNSKKQGKGKEIIFESYIRPSSSIFTGNILLSASSNERRTVKIEVIDRIGRIVKQKDVRLSRGEQMINLGELKSGIYFIKVSAEREDIHKITVIR
jgi:hypothetical protein